MQKATGPDIGFFGRRVADRFKEIVPIARLATGDANPVSNRL